MPNDLLSLPLLPPPAGETAASAPEWHGFTALGPVAESAAASPEPDAPQGEYTIAPADAPALPHTPEIVAAHPVELLAPAGGPDAAFAAFHYGADAVYLGLKKFSARAEAENFTLDECAEVTAYAHSLAPRRRVFVTINTLIRQDELLELVETVAALAEIGVDAIILQDLGVYHVFEETFPGAGIARQHAAVRPQPGGGGGAWPGSALPASSWPAS